MVTKSTIPAVGYIRMSTDQQEHSPQRQKNGITEYAAKNGMRVVRWYEDHGMTGTESANRLEFQKLLEDCQKGEFSAIVVSETSRMSREDPLDAMAHWRLFRLAGVAVHSSIRGEIKFGDMGSLITLLVDQYGAHDESRKTAHRTTSGKLARLRSGHIITKPIFGFDRIFTNPATGESIRVRYDQRTFKPAGWTGQIVPSAHKEAVEGVRWAFQAAAAGKSFTDIARGLNDRGLKSARGLAFTLNRIRAMLGREAYAGVFLYGKKQRGKFETITNDGKPFEMAHEGIVTPALFARVQEVLTKRPRQSKRGATYLLGQRVRCGKCGARCYGAESSTYRVYRCKNQCQQVMAGPLEQYVLRLIAERVLSDENRERLERLAVQEDAQRRQQPQSKDQAEVGRLQRCIETAQRNLALAETPEDFKAISASLRQWKQELQTAEQSVEDVLQAAMERSETVAAVKHLAEYRGKLGKANPAVLSAAIVATIHQVTLKKKDRFDAKGNVEFSANAYAGESIEFKYEDLFGQLLTNRILEAVVKAGGFLDWKTATKRAGVKRGSVHNLMKAAALAGRCKIGRKGIKTT